MTNALILMGAVSLWAIVCTIIVMFIHACKKSNRGE